MSVYECVMFNLYVEKIKYGWMNKHNSMNMELWFANNFFFQVWSYSIFRFLECDDGNYGYDYVNNCSVNCSNDSPCNKQTGHCDEGCDLSNNCSEGKCE